MPHLNAKITSGYWRTRLDSNAESAIFHQWEQLEGSGCIDNFRLAAGLKEGFREGFFFADSDAYKWLEAAGRILGEQPNPTLKTLVDDFIGLLEAAQTPEGYLYTYNQLHFPGQRWVNLQVEHEFYCLGHLIEAGVSHHIATGEIRLLGIARRAADLLVQEISSAPPIYTDGHEEIEIALLRLHQLTGQPAYLELASRLLERRGRISFFGVRLMRQASNHYKVRSKIVAEQRQAYLSQHPEHAAFKLPPGNFSKNPPFSGLRRWLSLWSGKYFQQNAPIRRQSVPVGHSVRFTYLSTASATLAHLRQDAALQHSLEKAWERMVNRRMYVTGGIGSVNFIEGFGRDDELHPEYAYAETCAALGSLFWNREMLANTGAAQYADLFEWQLYNAASVGMSLDGKSYLYNNPLSVHAGVQRVAWYSCPCCPSNLSRTFAWLAQDVLRAEDQTIWIDQYFTSTVQLPAAGGTVQIEAGLPWSGDVTISPELPAIPITIHLRVPSWAGPYAARLNGTRIQPDSAIRPTQLVQTDCGYDPRQAFYISFTRLWQPGDRLDIVFDMPVRLLRQSERIDGCGGMLAVARGPLVYCLESVDNPLLDIFTARVNTGSLKAVYDPQLLGGAVRLDGKTAHGKRLTMLPYFLWANRGPSQMTVFMQG